LHTRFFFTLPYDTFPATNVLHTRYAFWSFHPPCLLNTSTFCRSCGGLQDVGNTRLPAAPLQRCRYDAHRLLRATASCRFGGSPPLIALPACRGATRTTGDLTWFEPCAGLNFCDMYAAATAWMEDTLRHPYSRVADARAANLRFYAHNARYEQAVCTRVLRLYAGAADILTTGRRYRCGAGYARFGQHEGYDTTITAYVCGDNSCAGGMPTTPPLPLRHDIDDIRHSTSGSCACLACLPFFMVGCLRTLTCWGPPIRDNASRSDVLFCV